MRQPEFGHKVAALRSEKGMTQEQLAELCEVSTRTIQRIENGEVDPRSFTLNNLSKSLDYNFGESQDTGDSLWLILLHLSSIFCIFPIPLLLWIWKKDSSDPVDRCGRSVLNFQLTMTILMLGAAVLCGLLGLGLFLLFTKQGDPSGSEVFFLPLLALSPLFLVASLCWYQGLKNAISVIKKRKTGYPFSIPFIK